MAFACTRKHDWLRQRAYLKPEPVTPGDAP